jgi:hypothetical protein
LHTRAILILLIVTISSFIVPTYASSFRISVNKQQLQVQATFALTLNQNMTQLPSQTNTVDQATDPQLASAFSGALNKQANGTATPSQLTLNIASASHSLSVTVNMLVSGVSSRQGDILTVDMGWKALNITSDLRAGNLSYNTIGRRYFRPIVEFYVNASRFIAKPNATFTGIGFFINQTSIGPTAAEDYAGNFTFLDFTQLGVPLERWQRAYSLPNDTTTWRFTPTQTLDFFIATQRQNRTTEYSATYGYDAEITVPGLARAQGDKIVVEVGEGRQELAMAGIITLSIILAIAVQLSFRSKKKKYAKFGRR